MLTKDNITNTIDAILKYKIIDEKANYMYLNGENLYDWIQQVSQTTLRNNKGS